MSVGHFDEIALFRICRCKESMISVISRRRKMKVKLTSFGSTFFSII